MGIVTVILSVVFLVVGFLITPANTTYLLSGYNSFSEEELLRFDLNGYLRLFSSFHVFLAVSLLPGGLILGFTYPDAASFFLILYPLITYEAFIL